MVENSEDRRNAGRVEARSCANETRGCVPVVLVLAHAADMEECEDDDEVEEDTSEGTLGRVCADV